MRASRWTASIPASWRPPSGAPARAPTELRPGPLARSREQPALRFELGDALAAVAEPLAQHLVVVLAAEGRAALRSALRVGEAIRRLHHLAQAARAIIDARDRAVRAGA